MGVIKVLRREGYAECVFGTFVAFLCFLCVCLAFVRSLFLRGVPEIRPFFLRERKTVAGALYFTREDVRSPNSLSLVASIHTLTRAHTETQRYWDVQAAL